MAKPEGNAANKNSPDQSSTTDVHPSGFHVVALGASAGGLESLEKFFESMPADSGLAFVVLQHLSPDFKSLMDELLARRTKMRIRKGDNGMLVEPNTIYLNPPRKNMIVSDGRLYLNDLDPKDGLSLPIDQFFRSMAQDYRRSAIAIVLSGTGSDGSRGVREVYDSGGLVISETEETAKFDGMPRSAQETGCVHLVLPPGAMPEALISYTHQSLSPQDFAERIFVPPRLEGMEAVFRLIRDHCGIDFSLYKPNTVIRRVERRLALQHSMTIDDYAKFLEQDEHELNALYRDLLIGVTKFFRDPDAFEYLSTKVLPEILAEKETGDELRIWVAGCASGEEAYSMAILADECIRKLDKNIDVKIFATDVHPTSLDFAGAGIYDADALTQMKPERVTRYFHETQGGYRVRNNLRQMIVFARHNVVKDPPFTKLDLISCRNLLIYLQPIAQRKAISLFHFGLRPNGTLLLGPSESPGELKEEFETCNHRWKVYRKRRDARLPAEVRLPIATDLDSLAARNSQASTTSSVQQRSMMQAYDSLLDKFIPCGFLIDERRQLLHVFGDAGKFLKNRSGRISQDLLDLANGNLRPALASIIERARRDGIDDVSTPVRWTDSGQAQQLLITVSRLQNSQAKQTWFFVLLDLRSSIAPQIETSRRPPMVEVSQDQMSDLQTELRYTKENLQSTVEELEASNEELQSTNEELVASNEELQSTNEELHSVNEELYSVNAEYQNKITELVELSHDMECLLESTEIGTIFLDSGLAIRKYTGNVEEWFELVSRDIGRKISAFSSSLRYAQLSEDLQNVLDSGESLEREVQDRIGRWLHVRLNPYLREGTIEGVVMTLIDISNLKQTKAKLQRLSAIVESSDDAIIGKSFSGRIESWNRAAEKLFGFTAEEAIGKNIELILPPKVIDEAPAYFDQIRRGESVEPIETRRRNRNGQVLDIAVRFSPIRDEAGNVVGLSAICRDISRRKEYERELKKLALVADRTDNAVVIMGPEGEVEWVNLGFSRITGYSLDDVHGERLANVLRGPNTNEATLDYVQHQLNISKAVNVEILNYTKHGRPYWAAVEIRPIHDKSGKLTGFIEIQSDIDKLKAAEESARQEVIRRDSFLAMLSHELRNPLGAITSGLQLLRDQTTPDDDSQEVRDILAMQSDQMSRLLDDLLDVSRITTGKILIRQELIDLRCPAEEAAEVVEREAYLKGCQVQLELPPDPVYVLGDSVRLQQVITNLLTNAIRNSSRDDSITLQISQDEEQATVVVRDVGKGIEPALQERIFDLFFQAEDDLARTHGGLGVGLSLVKDLVHRHGGTIRLFSEGVGRGTTVTVTLPLTSCDAMPEEDEPAIGEIGSLTVAVIEDQQANRYLLKRLLEKHGHRVLEADNGTDGVEIVMSHRPDLALIDIGLPDISGYDVAARIRAAEDGSHTKLAAITGYGQTKDVEKALQSGFDVHFVKPIEWSKVAGLMASLERDK